MKKLATLLLSISLIIFLGCKEEEENFITPLVGTWENFSLASSGCDDPDENGTLTCTGGPCFELTINSNNTYTLITNLVNPPITESGTVTVTATSITLCEAGDTDCTPDSYTLTGDSLVIIYYDDDSPGCVFTAALSKKA